MPRTEGRQERARKAREKRRIKRQQIERSYREHVPPQIRAMRQNNWFERENPVPQVLLLVPAHFACPYEGCGKTFGEAQHLRRHMENKHYPHEVREEH